MKNAPDTHPWLPAIIITVTGESEGKLAFSINHRVEEQINGGSEARWMYRRFLVSHSAGMRAVDAATTDNRVSRSPRFCEDGRVSRHSAWARARY